MFALVDCNNFYASCERVFNPGIERLPIIVLSNNDGCAIARSEEAKVLGIQMGTPAFLIQDMIVANNVQVFSSNYTLYGDLSQRVMTILSEFAPAIELYSIDEAFLDLCGMGLFDLEDHCRKLRQKVGQHLGIPVSIGIAPTKTLAKMANRYAKKKKREKGIHWVRTQSDMDELLTFTEVGDIWGIGHERAKLLLSHGLKTAADLAKAPEEWVRKKMTVMGQRLLNELRGVASIEWELETPPRKHICTSRSFGVLMTEKLDILQAVANYAAMCGEKLRQQHSCCEKIHVFIQTNPHRMEDRQYTRSLTMPLSVASNSTGELIQAACKIFNMIFQPGFNYMKCGVTVMDLVPESDVQTALFDRRLRPMESKAMQVMDAVNKAKGRELVRMASQGFDKKYKLRCEHLSYRYTTRIEDIVKVK